MHALFRLDYFALAEARLANYLDQGVRNFAERRKGDASVQVGMIFYHGRPVSSHRLARKVRKSVGDECLGQLDLTLTTDIIENNIVTIADAPHRASVIANIDQRFHRFVILASAIRCAHRLGEGARSIPIQGSRSIPIQGQITCRHILSYICLTRLFRNMTRTAHPVASSGGHR